MVESRQFQKFSLFYGVKFMNFEEKDISLAIDGMGIVFYSPETNREIPEGSNFFSFLGCRQAY